MTAAFPHPHRSWHLSSYLLIAIAASAVFVSTSSPRRSSIPSSSGHSSSSSSSRHQRHQRHAPTSVFRIVEELPPGTTVGNVKQIPDLVASFPRSVLSQLEFSFRHSGSAYLYFYVDQSTGILRTSKRIDREVVCADRTNCSLLLEVIVGPNQHFRLIRIVVNVDDINDNEPRFPVSRFDVEINENVPVGTRYPLPGAIDADSPAYGVQSYALIHANAESEAKFELNTTEQDDGSKAVSLVLRSRLDREGPRDSYAVTVVAYDGGSPSRSASLLVGVAVGDANDNGPVFDEASYEVSLSERLIPTRTPVGRVHATDRDAGRNGEVRYALTDFTEANYGRVFGVDPLSGDVYLQNSLDYERQRAYTLVVIASDLGTRSLSSFVKVSVAVVDENDNPPKITVNPLSVSGVVAIPENSDPGTSVAHLVTDDADSGKNSEVECSVYDDRLFQLERTRESEYRLVSSSVFDRETGSHYVVTLTCHDGGQPPLTVTKAVEIEVLDENDNAPVLFHGDPVVVQVDENNLPGAEVGRVEASDADAAGLNSQLRFHLTPDDELDSASLVTLNAITGRIRVNDVLDYEHRTDYTFQLKVFDLGEPSQTTLASLVLRVRDVNDETPRFDKPAYYFFVLESLAVGSAVGVTTATDRDRSLRFSQVHYRLVDAALPFHIDPDTGRLSLARKLDREDAQAFRFVVIGQNPEPFGHVHSGVNVTVYVDDVNDNDPIVRFPVKGNNVVYVASGARNGSLVTRVDAWDPDEGRNAKLSYSISHGNDDAVFHIDDETGAVTLAGARQYDQQRDSYNLVISVRDAGDPARVTIVDLSVKVNHTGGPVDSQDPSSFSQQFGRKMSDKLIIIVGMVAAFFVIIFVIMFILLLSLVRRRRRSRDAKRKLSAAGITELRPMSSSNADRSGSELDSELDKYSGRFSSRLIERCSNRDCPFSSRDKTPTPVPVQTGNERRHDDDVTARSETKAPDSGDHSHKKLHDDAITRLSCDEVLRSRVLPVRRPRHVVAASKSCEFLGSAAARLCHLQDQSETQQQQQRVAIKVENPPRDSYEYSDCSDSCIDSGLDPNEDCDHVTYAAMTEICESYMPVN